MFMPLLDNRALECALLSWFLAQVLKPPIGYLRYRKWNWALLLSAGGMPSSHSALMVGATMGIGLYEGFDTSLFALAVATTMIIVYDATGVRREAGRHAEKINLLINELFEGHPISDKQLREVLGHTPLEVTGGILLAIVISILFWMIYPA